jgi:DNA-binding transcriptional MerR regulator
MPDDPSTVEESVPTVLRPAEVAERLAISAATLRRWSSRFGEFLELSDGTQDGGSHRRYTENDLATLARVQQLLEQGWTYEQVADRLAHGSDPVERSVDAIADRQSAQPPGEATASFPADTAMVAAGPLLDTGTGVSADVLPPAARFLHDTMQAVTSTQQIILNSQQASRDMLGVMIQDNLNLKGENTSLRERMLELERELAELQRHFADNRERTEIRMRVLEDAIAKLMTGPPPPAARSGPPAGAQPTSMPPSQPPQANAAPPAGQQAYTASRYAPSPYPPAGYPPQPQPSASYPQPYATQPASYETQPPPKRGFWARLLGG